MLWGSNIMGVAVDCTFVTSYKNIVASFLTHMCRLFKNIHQFKSQEDLILWKIAKHYEDDKNLSMDRGGTHKPILTEEFWAIQNTVEGTVSFL